MANQLISVIIPVQNDSQRLVECLQALQRQSYPNFEVIVVDNNSTEAIQPICRSFAARYCRENQLGNNAARNRGIAAAAGEVIAFTDSDCIPDSDWLMQGMEAIQQSPMVGGAIRFTWKGQQPNVVEYADSISYLRQRDYVETEHYGAGANLFVQRRLFEAVGGFDSRLMNLGDKEFCQRASAAGYKIAYAQSAIVYHPARYTLKSLLHKARRQARASVRLAALQGKARPRANFLPLGYPFWRAVSADTNLPQLRQKLLFAGVIHCLKWTIAVTLLFSPQNS